MGPYLGPIPSKRQGLGVGSVYPNPVNYFDGALLWICLNMIDHVSKSTFIQVCPE
jgi:hypothetical protein